MPKAFNSKLRLAVYRAGLSGVWLKANPECAGRKTNVAYERAARFVPDHFWPPTGFIWLHTRLNWLIAFPALILLAKALREQQAQSFDWQFVFRRALCEISSGPRLCGVRSFRLPFSR